MGISEGNIITKRGGNIKRRVKKNYESSAPGVLRIKNMISFTGFKTQVTPDKNLPDLILLLTFLNNETTASVALPAVIDEQNRFCTKNKNLYFLYSF